MVYWVISDLPLGLIGICTCIDGASIFLFDPNVDWKALISIFSFLTSTMVLLTGSAIHYIQKIRLYNEKLEKIIIPEFIEKRPFKETDVMQKDQILEIILRNVNAKFISSMKTRYIFRNIEQLLAFHNYIITEFTKRYFEKYKDLPLEDIQGWDRILLVAKNIQDEDLRDVYADMISPDIVQKYSNIRPTTQENGLATTGV